MRPYYDKKLLQFLGVEVPRTIDKTYYTPDEVNEILQLTKGGLFSELNERDLHINGQSNFIQYITSTIPPNKVKLVTAKIMSYYTFRYNREMDVKHVSKFFTQMLDTTIQKFTLLHLGAIVNNFLMYPINISECQITTHDNACMSRVLEAPLGNLKVLPTLSEKVLSEDIWLTFGCPMNEIDIDKFSCKFVIELNNSSYILQLNNSFSENQYRKTLMGVDNMVYALIKNKWRFEQLDAFLVEEVV